MQWGSQPLPVPEQGQLVWREVIAVTRTTPTRRRALVSCLPARKRNVLSEDGAAGLVRLVSWRRLPRCAGSIGTSNVACRGRTPDLTTAIQAVAKSGVGAGRMGAVTRITDLPPGRLPRTLPMAHGGTQGQLLTRRFGRVRPRDSCMAAQRSISGRSQSFTRPGPRSNTGFGMSAYRL
jgi:hypothetical protein